MPLNKNEIQRNDILLTSHHWLLVELSRSYIFAFVVHFYHRCLCLIPISGIFSLKSMDRNKIIKEILICTILDICRFYQKCLSKCLPQTVRDAVCLYHILLQHVVVNNEYGFGATWMWIPVFLYHMFTGWLWQRTSVSYKLLSICEMVILKQILS